MYSSHHSSFHYVPDELLAYLEKKRKDENDYYYKKYLFLESNGFFTNVETEFTVQYSPKNIKSNLANLRQLLIEVTDGCNLSCKYCGYGELYGDYDKRSSKKNDFATVKSLIDYLVLLWESSLCTSYNNVVNIGFYGGEPLLNFGLIRQVIEYVEALPNLFMKFSFSMTTNAFFLDRYMDYLVDKKIKLLISLDGNQINNSYRCTKENRESFDVIVGNVVALKLKYSDYYSRFVDFNSVLHNRNSVKDIVEFIGEKFGKIPRIVELSENGIRQDKKTEFATMFRNKFESFKEVSNCSDDAGHFETDPSVSLSNFFLDAFTNQTFKRCLDLFVDKEACLYIPTGTCKPFHRKIFLTVNGKILPCEKIGQNHVMGHVDNNIVDIDFERISQMYSEYYMPLIALCKDCAINRNCGKCVFHIKASELTGKSLCNTHYPQKYVANYLGKRLSVFEDNRNYYAKIMKELVII